MNVLGCQRSNICDIRVCEAASGILFYDWKPFIYILPAINQTSNCNFFCVYTGRFKIFVGNNNINIRFSFVRLIMSIVTARSWWDNVFCYLICVQKEFTFILDCDCVLLLKNRFRFNWNRLLRCFYCLSCDFCCNHRSSIMCAFRNTFCDFDRNCDCCLSFGARGHFFISDRPFISACAKNDCYQNRSNKKCYFLHVFLLQLWLK